MIRDIEYLEDNIQVSILSERRVFKPYGMQGGKDGKSGLNLWIRHVNGDKVLTLNLSGKNTALFGKGDRIIVQTPGGGGYGEPGHVAPAGTVLSSAPHPIIKASGSLGAYKEMQEST